MSFYWWWRYKALHIPYDFWGMDLFWHHFCLLGFAKLAHSVISIGDLLFYSRFSGWKCAAFWIDLSNIGLYQALAVACFASVCSRRKSNWRSRLKEECSCNSFVISLDTMMARFDVVNPDGWWDCTNETGFVPVEPWLSTLYVYASDCAQGISRSDALRITAWCAPGLFGAMFYWSIILETITGRHQVYYVQMESPCFEELGHVLHFVLVKWKYRNSVVGDSYASEYGRGALQCYYDDYRGPHLMCLQDF